MARETLKDFLNSIGSGADKISYTRSDSPDGLGIETNTGKELLDLVNEAEGLLGDYLKYIVDDSTNDFKLKGGNEEAAPNRRGDSLALADDQGAESVFVQQGTEQAAKLNEYSNSRKFDESGTDLNSLIDKTGKSGNFHNGLADIQGRPLSTSPETLVDPNGEDNDIVQATQKMFLHNNRFANVGSSENNAFSVNPQNIEEFEEFANNRGTLTLQKNFGLYDKEEYKASFDRLKNIGASLLLKASGYYDEDTPGDAAKSTLALALQEEMIAAGHKDAANISSTGYLKKDISKTRAKNAPGFPSTSTGDSVRAGKGEFVVNDPDANNSKTFGSTYNSTVTFSSKNRTVHKIQAAISVIALKTIAKEFFDTFKSYLKQEDAKALEASTDEFLQQHGRSQVGVYMIGQSRNMTSLVLDANIFSNMLTATKYPYGSCVDRGLEISFGIEEDAEGIAGHSSFSQSPGFWMAVANSILKTYDNITNRIAQIDTDSYRGKEIMVVMKSVIEENSFIKFLNVMAVIGDCSLQSTNSLTGETDPKNVTHVRDVDGLENLAGNRVGKSRKTKGQIDHSFFDIKGDIGGEETLAWEQSATPSMYLLPVNMIRAASRLNNSVRGASPQRGMLGSRMVRNTYFSIDVDGTFNRIPNNLVKMIEDKLEAEYVPFYIQDLRTNEILSFHAFLTNLTDSITPSYNPVTGYGRLDPVQIYQGTQRSLQLGFNLYATNREDFDEMWYKINKFVTLLYPQWTQGTMVDNGAGNFYQAFSQVIGPSPIVRLRVGDVIKSNYSRFALARTFGIGDKEVTARPADDSNFFSFLMAKGGGDLQKVMNEISDVLTLVYVAVFGSPIGLINSVAQLMEKKPGMGGTLARMGTDIGMNLVSRILVNGFANPLLTGQMIKGLRDPNVYNGAGQDSARFQTVLVKPDTNIGYYSPTDNKTYLPSARATGKITDRVTYNGKILYKILIVDGASSINGTELLVPHSGILVDPGPQFTTSAAGWLSIAAGLDVAGLVDNLMQGVHASMPNEVNMAVDILRALISSPESAFMDAANNPFTRAFDTTKGRGLAGVIEGVSFNWLGDFPWETDYNARAPKGVEISFNFKVIHDIPPGLDHSGYNRAPLYNVGSIMRNVAGDVYSDDGRNGEASFTSNTTTRVQGEKKGK